MSTYEQTTIHCVHCRAEIVCSMLVGMHITRLPEVRTAILNDDFQKVSCPKCDFVNIVEKPSILTDFERKHYIGIETSQTENWKDKVKNHRLAFEQTFLWGPPIAQEMGRSMITRVVFGLRALREKLILWDAGYDDRIIEIGKKEILHHSDIDPQKYFLRVHKIVPSTSLICALFEKPQPNSSEKERFSRSRAIDSVTIFDKTLNRWHQQSHILIERNPWARDEWLVDSSIAGI